MTARKFVLRLTRAELLQAVSASVRAGAVLPGKPGESVEMLVDRLAPMFLRWGGFAQELTTALHEVIGHGSGRMAPGVTGPPHRLPGEHYSALEEARADLVALGAPPSERRDRV